jgi:hypothetical protein
MISGTHLSDVFQINHLTSAPSLGIKLEIMAAFKTGMASEQWEE